MEVMERGQLYQCSLWLQLKQSKDAFNSQKGPFSFIIFSLLLVHFLFIYLNFISGKQQQSNQTI